MPITYTPEVSELCTRIRGLKNLSREDLALLKLAVQYQADTYTINHLPKVGDRVAFGKPHGTKRVGTVKKVNEKSVMVDVNGMTWRVSPSLITVVPS